MAVSTLEQRLIPLVDTQPVWQPWGPAGRYPIEQVADDCESDSDSDDAGDFSRSIKRHQTWAGYTSYSLRLRFGHQLSEVTAAGSSAQEDDGPCKHEDHSWGQHLEAEAAWSCGDTGSSCQTSQVGSGHESTEGSVCGPSVGLFLSERSQFFSECSQGSKPTPLPTPKVKHVWANGGTAASTWCSSSKATLSAVPCSDIPHESAGAEYEPNDPLVGEEGGGSVAEEQHGSEPASSSQSGTVLEQSRSRRRTDKTSAPPAITTLMVQNLPYLMSREDFLADVDCSGFAGTYNFCHMPRSFKTGKNKGFAFLNFTSESFAERFASEWYGRRYAMHAFAKAIRVQHAAFQGIEACERIAQSKRMKRVKTGAFKPWMNFGPDSTSSN